MNNNMLLPDLIFVPEGVNEYDLPLFLTHHNFDVLLHQSEVKYIKDLCDYIDTNKIEGDVLECGVWKGGSAVLLRKYLARKWFVLNRTMLLADFFGVNPRFNIIEMHPEELATFKAAKDLNIHPPKIGDVIQLLSSFNFFDSTVHFLCGDVRVSLKSKPLNKIAFLHVDVDFYEATTTVLETAYPAVTAGGVILINDYNIKNLNCKQAVMAFREKYRIDEPIVEIGRYMAYWIKG